jgi:hypothetical protein
MAVFKGRLHDSIASYAISTKIDCGIDAIVLTLSESHGSELLEVRFELISKTMLLEVRFELISKTIWLTGHGIGVSGNPAFHFPVGRIA